MRVRVDKGRASDLGPSILRSIISDGIVCTSEELKVSNDPLRVKKLGETSFSRSVSRQTRACFTLCSFDDLFTERAEASFLDGGGGITQRMASHSDLFGPFAIGLDPVEARRIGVLPAIYYYSTTGVEDAGPEDLLRRLSEARQALVALHYVEAQSEKYYIPFLHTDVSHERTDAKTLGLKVDKAEVQRKLDEVRKGEAISILELFAFDRRTAWQIVDKLQFLLGLFQNTDSTIEDSPLAFYEQREWRLSYNSQTNTKWFSIGNHPKIRDPNRVSHTEAVEKIVADLQRNRNRPLTQEERNATWVLFEVDQMPFSRMIREIVCPKAELATVTEIIETAKKSGRVRADIRIRAK